MLEFKGVNKTFNKGRADSIKALVDVNLQVTAGDFVSLLGANGSGKSTLLNSLCGRTFVDAGEINLWGRPIHHLPEYKRSKWFGRVFQDPLLGTSPELTVMENFRLGAMRSKGKSLKIGMDKAFRELVREKVSSLSMHLEDKLDMPIGRLSGGQRQALSLLMTTMDDVQLLLLDEPTAALDPKTAKIIMRLTEKLVEDHRLTAIFITHNIKDALQYGNRLLHMSEGRIVRDLGHLAKKSLLPEDILSWFD